MPPSFEYSNQTKAKLSPYMAEVDFDFAAILAEDAENEALDMPLRCAMIIPVDLGLEDGMWTTLPDGTQLWQMEVNAPGALAISLGYEKFIIPEGGKLFAYNPERTKIIGAFTHKTNPLRLEFATEFVYGDKIILEYVAPEKDGSIPTPPEIKISDIHYGYNHIMVPLEDGSWTKSITMEPCMLNINCPEGDEWQDQKKGVVKSYCGGYLCSGSMINNTAQNFDPLVLSAFHCYEDISESYINQAVYYFHYERTGCANSSAISPNLKTIVGAQYIVKIPWDYGSDGALLRLNEAVPENYDVYFNGWDRRDIGATSGVSIHHPDGNYKRISTYTQALQSFKYNTCANNAHWKVYWAATVSGHSSTEGGSSGSPIFNQDGLIVGSLSGGQASCYNLNGYDAYGKLWYHWDQYTNQNMKPYLDPINSGAEYIQGAYVGAVSVEANFVYSPDEVIVGKEVQFTDKSVGASTYNWSFEGGLPSESTLANPKVVFDEVGEYEVSLTINKGTDKEESKTLNLVVNDVVLPKADFTMNSLQVDTVTVYTNEIVHFSSTSIGTYISYSWQFEGGFPASSTSKSARVSFASVGMFDVKLTITSEWGTDYKEKVVVVEAQPPVPNFESTSDYYSKYPDHGQYLPYEGASVNFIDRSENTPESWAWTFTGASPASSSSSSATVDYPEGRKKYPVSLSVENEVGVDMVEKQNYIQVGGTAPIWNIPFGKDGTDFIENGQNNYLTGTNSYYTPIAERFDFKKKGTIQKIDILMNVMAGDVSGRGYQISLYSERDGAPGTLLARKMLSGSKINLEGYSTVEFDSPIAIEGPFFVAIGGLGSNVAKVAIGASEVETGTVYVAVNSIWTKMADYFSGEKNVSMNILPYYKYEAPPMPELYIPYDFNVAYSWQNLSVQLSWNLEMQDDYTASFNIYRDGELIASNVKDMVYEDMTFVDDSDNCYTIEAVYNDNQEWTSERSASVCAFVNTSINNISVSAEIYPNPAENELTVSSPALIQSITVYNIQGSRLQEYVVNDYKKIITTSLWDKGLYLIKIKYEDGTMLNHKLIKK